MHMTLGTPSGKLLTCLAITLVLTGCADGLVDPAAEPQQTIGARRDLASNVTAEQQHTVAALRRATARYHDLDAAIADDFVLLHECEVRPGEGAVGVLYVHLGRYMDGILDPASPDGLLYAPTGNGLRLAGVELALPAAAWTAPEPPSLLGMPLQAEEEFGAFGLHVWAWHHNPDGMFAQAHPGIECEPAS